jgi:hypothetical protein
MIDKAVRINKSIAKAKAAKELDTNLISDGYHTFGELYAHRIELFIALCRVLTWHPTFKGSVYRQQVDDEWFILGMTNEAGEQMSYHIPMEKYPECGFALWKVPAWDGHTSADVLARLRAL